MGRKAVLGAAVAGLAAAFVVGLAGPAPAGADTVTLEASRTTMRYGRTTTLSGAISPAAPGQTVQIVDAATSEVLATETPDAATGAYETRLAPEANVSVKAVWNATESEVVDLKVRPILSAALGAVRLFDRARVAGRLEPAHPGQKVRVILRRGSRVVDRRRARLVEGERFRTRFDILRTGRYRAEVRFSDADHLAARRKTERRTAPLPPSLDLGSRGRYVRLLEGRLRHLGYLMPAPDRRYDFRTADAIVAFHKVQGMSRVGRVGRRTWKRLQTPRRPRPRAARPGFHIEIDQTRQVIYVVRRGTIDEIVHTSTGAGGATHDGVFQVHRKIAGYSPNRLYYPSYFDANRAVHGWPEVPTYPASHGCARVPYWTAIHLHNVMPIGTVVRVYHS